MSDYDRWTDIAWKWRVIRLVPLGLLLVLAATFGRDDRSTPYAVILLILFFALHVPLIYAYGRADQARGHP